MYYEMEEKIMKKLLSILLSLAIMFVIPMTSIADENDITRLTVSEVTHSVFYAPQYVAINLGIFEKHGIELDLISSQGADKVMTAVLSGQVDIGFAGPEAAIYVYLEGKKITPKFSHS